MADLAKRVELLSPERRRLLGLLVQQKDGRRSPAAAGEAELEPAGCLTFSPGDSPDDARATTRRFYNTVSRQLDSTIFGKYAYFLNFGYVPDGNTPQYSRFAPETILNKNSVRLALEVIGDCELTGRRVLDIGCGRGGTISVICQFFQPRSIIGLDLSSAAIAFCRREHRHRHVSFLEGDAERVPLRDDSVDVVTNLESSHSYPDIDAFYREVFRILRRGGYFLYTDILPVDRVERNSRRLRELGFVLEKDQDITRNVLLSCDEISRRRTRAFHNDNDAASIGEFLAVPGSTVYEEMASGASTYRIFKFRSEKVRGTS